MFETMDLATRFRPAAIQVRTWLGFGFLGLRFPGSGFMSC